MRKGSNNSLILKSITEKIDDIFNQICLKINEVIGLRFFLRKTLGECEFGVCYDFDLENVDQNCLVDKDPLLFFNISVKSKFPILAAILIIGLVYIASILASISEWTAAFPTKIIKKFAKETLKEVASFTNFFVKGRIHEIR